MIKLIEREVRDGKPYGGTFIGKCVVINSDIVDLDNPDGKELARYKELVKIRVPDGLELRHEGFIYRPAVACVFSPLSLKASVAIKGLLWGRAFKVMRYFAKGKKMRKKRYVSGRRRKIWVIRG